MHAASGIAFMLRTTVEARHAIRPLIHRAVQPTLLFPFVTAKRRRMEHTYGRIGIDRGQLVRRTS
mgnify:FL=1